MLASLGFGSVLLFLYFLCGASLVHGHSHSTAKNETGPKIHRCIHDQLTHDPVRCRSVPYLNHPYDRSFPNLYRRQLSSSDSTYEKIRMTPYWEDLESTILSSEDFDVDDLNYVKTLVSSAIRYIESFTKVVPVSGTFYVPRRCVYFYRISGFVNCASLTSTCGTISIPADHLDVDYLYSANRDPPRVLPQGRGIEGSDYALYVSLSDTNCAGATIAWAQTCAQDQYGRPVAGVINLCERVLSSQFWKQDLLIVVHEIMHTIIMQPGLWDDFKQADGTDLPRQNVVTSRTSAYGENQYYIISPQVKRLAQEHFGCYDEDVMPGLPLEDDGSPGSAGSHWEEHHVNTELMGSTIYSAMMFVSEFTLALMQDSGWYEVDYAYAEPFFWGHGEGCKWFEEDCIDKSSESSNWPQYFCDSPSDDGCSYDYAGVGNCLYSTNLDVPEQFQYYSDSSHGGSSSSEYCSFRDPDAHYVAGWEEVCWDVNSLGIARAPSPYPAIRFGASSRCVETKDSSGRERGFCFEHECFAFENNQWQGVYIYIGQSERITCLRQEKLETKTSTETGLEVTCPDVDTICRNSQPFACIWGNWDDSLQRCICSPGYTGDECQDEDRGQIKDGIQLGPQVTETEALPPESQVCMRGLPPQVQAVRPQWEGDNWVYDGMFNEYPSYVLSGSNTYLYWYAWYHAWIIASVKGSIQYDAYCIATEFAIDISDCNGLWRVDYNSQTRVVPDIETFFGSCEDVPASGGVGNEPSDGPTQRPTPTPSNNPSSTPSESPTWAPTSLPSGAPVPLPSRAPTRSPTKSPSVTPSKMPSSLPFAPTSATASVTPYTVPTTVPSDIPSLLPSVEPSDLQSQARAPSAAVDDVASQTVFPTLMEPVLVEPTIVPLIETTNTPTASPSMGPSMKPTLGPTEGLEVDILELDSGDGGWVCPSVCKSLGCKRENPFCATRRHWFCVRCEDDYFMNHFLSPCVQCQETLGKACLECRNWVGCVECAQGFELRFDADCGINYCQYQG